MSNDYTPWAENGALEPDTTFTETAIETGFLAERLPAPRLNRLLNRVDRAANDLATRGGLAVDGTDPRQQEAEHIWSHDSVAIGCSSRNRMENLGTEYYREVYPTTISGVRKILACNYLTAVSAVLDVFDVDTMAFDAYADLSAGYGTPTGVWRPRGCCADGTLAYVAMEDSVLLDTYVQCFSMSDWTVNPDWPATGTQIAGGGGFANSHNLIFANSTHLATLSTGANPLISLIARSDGTITDTGDGDYSAAGIRTVVGNMVSNGNYLFFCCDTQLCSADITDLSVGTGGTGWPLTVHADMDYVACAGPLVICSGYIGNIIVAHEDNVVFATATLGISDGAGGIAFDGINFWCHCCRLFGSTVRQQLYKIPAWQYTPENTTTATNITHTGYGIYCHTYDPYLVHPTTPLEHLISDGRDLWWVGSSSSDAFTGKIFRLPWSRLRG